MIEPVAEEYELKQYLVDCLEKCGVFLGRTLQSYPVLELFEVYFIYAEEHELIDAVPDIREQIIRGKYNQDTKEFLRTHHAV